jgi:hypothetical protein
MQNKPNLRKAQVNVNLYNTTDYEEKSNSTLGENEPNSKPIQTQTKPIPERPEMNANVFITKDYENETTLRPQKNKPNQSQFPPPRDSREAVYREDPKGYPLSQGFWRK